MEANLILQLEDKAVNIENNMNWTTSCDYGGEGPPPSADGAHIEHYVYLAIKPLPLKHDDDVWLQEERDAAASALQKEEREAAASAHQQDEP